MVLQTNALFRKEIRDRDSKKINFEAFYIPLIENDYHVPKNVVQNLATMSHEAVYKQGAKPAKHFSNIKWILWLPLMLLKQRRTDL